MFTKNLKYELLKLLRNRLIVFVSVMLIAANTVAAYLLCDPENDNISENYKIGILRVISDAENRYETEADKDGFSAKYYKMIVEKYSALDIDRGPEQVKGYGMYLSYIYADLFLLSCCAFCAAFAFRREKETGEIQTLYAYRYGRRSYAAVKLCSGAIVSVIFVLLFSASSFLGTAARGGFTAFSGAFTRLQDIRAFIYAPNEINVISAVILSTLNKIPVCIAVSFFAGCVSYLFNSGALSVAVSALFMYGSHWLNGKTYINKNAFFRNCNLFASIRPSNVYGELRCINLFGAAVPSYIMNVAVSVLLAIAFSALFFILHLNRASVLIRLPKLKLNIKREPKPAKPHGLFVYEIQKIFKSRLCAIALILILISACAGSFISVRAFPYPERVYKDYCERWNGKYADEIAEEYFKEGEKIAEGARAYFSMYRGNAPKDIEDPIKAADYYVTHYEGFELFSKKYDRLLSYKESGTDIPIIYEGGYGRFFGSGADLFLILAVAFICTYLSTYDTVNATENVVVTTKNGRKKLPQIKFGALMTVCFFIYAVFTLITFLSVYAVYGMDHPEAPVYTVPGYEMNGAMPLGLYVALIFVFRLIGTAALCLFSLGVSAIFKNQLTAVAVASGVYIIPQILQSRLEDPALRFIQPSLLLDGAGFMRLYPSVPKLAVSVVLTLIVPSLFVIPHLIKQRRR